LTHAVRVEGLSHRYGARPALDGVSFAVAEGEVFVFLGPNGGGKTTLFRALSTLVPVQTGSVEIAGYALPVQASLARRVLGVAFQAPSLDRKLTVAENLRYQAALYGLSSSAARRRSQEMLAQLGVADRADDLVETLSGGLRRRVELAKSMLHAPRVLLLDEPSTGLDPGARSDLWQYLRRLRDDAGVTILLTTHLLEEAERADRIAILNEGKLVALDTPEALRASVGGDSILIETAQPEPLSDAIRQKFAVPAAVVDGAVRLEVADGHHWIARLVEAFPDRIAAIRLGKPTLEDVFIEKTGHRFWRESAGSQP
jgi:ABC-2 type transport system ATP-binding protein